MEEVLRKLKVKSVTDRLKERELKRTFPRLKVQPVYIRQFHAAEEGCSINNAKRGPVQAKLTSKNNKIYIDTGLKDTELVPVRFMLIDNNNIIVCVRETTKEERNTKNITEDFTEWKHKLLPSGRYLLAAEVVDKSLSSKSIIYFKDQELAKLADSAYEQSDKPEGYLAPCIVTGAGNPEFKIGKKYEPGEVAIVPYARMGSRNFGIMLCTPDKIVNEYTQAKIMKIKSKRSVSTVYLKMKKQDGLVIKDIVLRYRSAVSYDVPVKYTINDNGKYYFITAVIDFDTLPLRELYWDLGYLQKNMDMKMI